MFADLSKRLQSSSAARWFAAKEPREKLIYGALATAAAIVLVWAGVWKPLSDWQSVQTNRHGNAQALLDWMRANESRARSAVEQGAAEPNRSILPIVTRAAEAEGLRVGRLQPESDGVVSVTLQGQSFNDLIAWVAALEDAEGIAVVRASIDAQEAPGTVNAQLRLR